MQTFVTPLGLGFAIIMGVLLIIVPRRYALAPVIIMTSFMTLGQAVLILGLHFYMIRILVLFGWARLLIRGEIRSLKFNPIDKALLWWTLSGLVINTLLWQTSEALVYQLGQYYNAVGMYFLFRFLVRDVDDIKRVFKITATLIVPLAAAMLMEWVTGRNVFAIFGVLHPVTQIRDGTLRCQGPFLSPILAGTFAATQLPFFVALWQQGRNRLLAALAILSSTVIILTAGSSGPILTFLAAIVGLCLWPWRKYMRTLRWGISLGLIGLHLVMKAPVWFLIGRIDVVSGSTGFHRAYLIDRFIATFSQWWLLGMKSAEAFGEQIHGDITNEYVWQAMNGGLLTLVLFILIIVRCFRGIGGFQALAEEPLPERRCVWALGASLFSHVVTYMSIQYFDQNFVNWCLLLALISAATGQFLNARHREPVTASQFSGPAEIRSSQLSGDRVSFHSREAY